VMRPGPSLRVDIGGLTLANPVLTASGTFGFGLEYEPYIDLKRLGAIMVKGITPEPRAGNPPPRLAETPAGLLNAIGLENPGVERFIEEYLPQISGLGTPIIVNIAGNSIEDYCRVAGCLDEAPGIAALEVNISCPNVKQGGMQFGTDPEVAASLVAAVRRKTGLPLIVKLSPNAGDLVAVARAVVRAGADSLSLINTLLGMAIDIRTRRPALGNVFGGLSGPAVKPVAVRMVYQVAREVEVPIIGMGGIVTWEDALEFILAGATAVAVGTGNFVDPQATLKVVEGLERYCREQGVGDIRSLVGQAL
jgi:dihydroorotate dehydrogenase (NAD+) catalytic subunit